MSVFAGALKCQLRRFGRRALCQIARNKISKSGGLATFSVAPDHNNLHFGLDGREKFCHTEFRTVLLSYLSKQIGWIWRMFCARSGLACRRKTGCSQARWYEERAWPEIARPADHPTGSGPKDLTRGPGIAASGGSRNGAPARAEIEERTMTELTPSVTTALELAAQPKAAALKDAALHGLYDPRREHDACGVGFIAHHEGRQVAPDHPRRPRHAGEPDASRRRRRRSADGRRRRPARANSRPLLPRGTGEGRHHAAAARTLRRRLSVHAAATPALRAHIEDIIVEAARDEGQTLIGFRDVPVDNSSLSSAPHIAASEPVHRQVFIGRSPDIATEDEFERRLYILRKVISARIHAETNGVDNGFYTVSMSARTIVYKGMFLAYQVAPYYKDLCRPALRERAGADPPALLDQHLPVVEAGASLPDGRPQWRDQHAARQRQLDGGAAGVGRIGAVRQGHLEAVADLLRGPVRHRLLRQRARVPVAGRLFAEPRHDDADPGSLGRQQAHGCRPQGFLRVSRRADGAVGRAGRGRLHRRPADRRDARPQRPAAGPLHRHQ